MKIYLINVLLYALAGQLVVFHVAILKILLFSRDINHHAFLLSMKRFEFKTWEGEGEKLKNRKSTTTIKSLQIVGRFVGCDW